MAIIVRARWVDNIQSRARYGEMVTDTDSFELLCGKILSVKENDSRQNQSEAG